MDEVAFLYIPHGSDESCGKIYITINNLHFISHMVQMKERLKRSMAKTPLLLYIPHGSDESMR